MVGSSRWWGYGDGVVVVQGWWGLEVVGIKGVVGI